MINNEWLLSIVVFIVSFILTLLVFRDFKIALWAGLLAIPAAFAGLIAINIQRRMAHKRVLTALQVEIRQAEKVKYQLQQELSAIANASDQLQQQINYRQNQLNSLQVQIADKQRSKQDLNLALMVLGEDKRRVEAAVYHLNQQKEELDLLVRSLKSQHYKSETKKNELLADLQHLKEEIAFQISEKQRLQETIDFLRNQMHEWHVADVEVREHTSPEAQKLLTAPNEPEDVERTSESVSEPEEKTADLEPTEFIDEVSSQLVQEPYSEDLDAEWAEFVAQLTYPEFEVLKAIVQQDNPNAAIKNIAESNITMPELLIDAINERAIATLGDIIIEPGMDAPAIAAPEYLETVKKLLEVCAAKSSNSI